MKTDLNLKYMTQDTMHYITFKCYVWCFGTLNFVKVLKIIGAFEILLNHFLKRGGMLINVFSLLFFCVIFFNV